MPRKAFKTPEMSPEEFLKRIRECGRVEYGDEELLRAVVKEAKCDCFQGVGRIFLNEFTKWYNCTPERVISLLKSSGLKWRFGPTENIILVDF